MTKQDVVSESGQREDTRMSAASTKHLGRPAPEELVPSRYALPVGEIEVLVVSDGVLSLPTPLLATNAEPAVRAAWLGDMFLPPDEIVWPLNQVVMRSGGRTILIDAGLGRSTRTSRWPGDGPSDWRPRALISRP
ncbi:MAG TPA: hypothetical protein VES20_20530 [Bryobacteraceae bacterium]|nr:hypothetical protein [Bryobacteraceae bacterium]